VGRGSDGKNYKLHAEKNNFGAYFLTILHIFVIY